MRILIAISFPIPGEFDGTAMLPITILRALKPRGVQVVVAHLRARPPWGISIQQGEFEDTPVYTVPPAAWLTGSGLKMIAREHPFELVHAQHHGGATRASFACERYSWPMVYEIHSLSGDEVESDHLGRGLAFRAFQRLERKVFRRAAAVIAPGEPVKQAVVEEHGVPEGRVHVIYPGIDLAAYEQHGEPAQIPGVNEAHKVIMFVGGIVHPNQGVPILIESLPSVFGAIPQARCVLVGGSVELAAGYRERLGEHAEKLIVLADQSPAQVVALARRADVLVQPRLACRENYSVQSEIAVYLASGRPIVATDFGDYRQLLGDTGAGLLCAVAPEPLAEAIKKVLTDPALAARLAAATGPVAREYFAMDRNVERYLDVYYSALVAGPRM